MNIIKNIVKTALVFLGACTSSEASERLHRVTFMTGSELGTPAVIVANSVERAQSVKYVFAPSDDINCIHVERRSNIYVYLNHYSAAIAGTKGFFVVRISSGPSAADEQTLHAWRNLGWEDGNKAGLLEPFSVPAGKAVSVVDFIDLHKQTTQESKLDDLERQINKLLGGGFHAKRSGSQISSVSKSGLFGTNDESQSSSQKVWHYLIAFTVASVLNTKNERPIIYFSPLKGHNEYKIEVYPVVGQAHTVSKFYIRLGKHC